MLFIVTLVQVAILCAIGYWLVMRYVPRRIFWSIMFVFGVLLSIYYFAAGNVWYGILYVGLSAFWFHFAKDSPAPWEPMGWPWSKKKNLPLD